MKILQVNKFFYVKGGSERYFFDVSSALEEAGHEIVHFSMQDDRNEESPYEEYFIRNIDFTGKKSIKRGVHYIYSLEASEMIKRLVKKTKPDVAHLHNIAHQLTPSVIVMLQQQQIPIVQTLHDYQLICPNYQMFTQGSPCERCKKHKYWNAITHTCVQDSKASSALSAFEMTFHNQILKSYEWGVNRYIAPSKFLYTKLLEWGIRKSQIAYLPHFVERERDANIRKKNQVLYVGRLSKEKGVHVLVDAAKELPDVEVLIAGEGEEREAIEAKIKKDKLKNCKLLGYKVKDELDWLVQESKAVIVPSLWWENAPLAVYEALALGTPVIGSNFGGLVELIQNGKNGYTFEPGNPADLAKKVEMLLNNGSIKTGNNRFGREEHLRKLVRIYETAQDRTAPKL